MAGPPLPVALGHRPPYYRNEMERPGVFWAQDSGRQPVTGGRRTLSAMPAAVQKRRCAIYTRKSTEEGLDQAFNTLDAHRDACQAYVASQRAEGWVLVPDHYDDGGFSGATLDRPGLRRLLADVEAGRVD